MYILDTDVLIDVQRGYAPAIEWFSSLEELPSVPGLVVMELIQDAQNSRRVRQALQLVEPLPVVWPTETDCERALSDFTNYHLSHNLGLLDSLIAACAMSCALYSLTAFAVRALMSTRHTKGLSATLCTFNVRHYRVVSELHLLQPYSR